MFFCLVLTLQYAERNFFLEQRNKGEKRTHCEREVLGERLHKMQPPSRSSCSCSVPELSRSKFDLLIKMSGQSEPCFM